jgi:hypothetical protein
LMASLLLQYIYLYNAHCLPLFWHHLLFSFGVLGIILPQPFSIGRGEKGTYVHTSA